MQLTGFPDDYYVTYFYKKYKKDIILYGTRKGTNKLILAPHDSTEIITINKNGKSWGGTWSSKGKSLPVALTPLNIASIQHPYAASPAIQKLKSENPYEYARTSEVKITQGKQETIGSYKVQWYADTTSGVRIFKLLNGANPQVMAKVNTGLEANFWDNVTSSYNCSEFEYKITISLLANNILSYHTFTSFYCGGANANHSDEGITIDLKTGNQLKLEDILSFGKDPELGKKMIEVLSLLYPSQMVKPKSENDYCDYTNERLWNIPGWWLTTKGLYVFCHFPHFANSCEGPEWAIIPYTTVTKYLSINCPIHLPQ